MAHSKAHRKAISEGLLAFHRGKRKIVGKVKSAVRTLRKSHQLRKKKQDLNSMFLKLRKHPPGSKDHVQHLKKIDALQREIKRMQRANGDI